MLWNILLADRLPPAFQPEIFERNIPYVIIIGENISRLILFGLAFLMPLKLDNNRQLRGFALYLMGLLFYFLSWILLIFFPSGSWSNSLPGLMAPAYTPMIWLLGTGMIGTRFNFELPFRKWYFWVCSVVFLIFHNLHTYLVISRL